MLTHVHARVRTRRINIFAYRSGLKLTSPNLANLAHGSSTSLSEFCMPGGRRTTLRTDASSLRSRPLRRPSHSSRQWANSGPTCVCHYGTRSQRPAPADGSSPKNHRALWGVGTATNQYRVCFVCPKFLPTIQRIAIMTRLLCRLKCGRSIAFDVREQPSQQRQGGRRCRAFDQGVRFLAANRCRQR